MTHTYVTLYNGYLHTHTNLSMSEKLFNKVFCEKVKPIFIASIMSGFIAMLENKILFFSMTHKITF